MHNYKQYSNLPLFRFATTYKMTVVGFLASLFAVVFLSSTMLADAIYFDDPEHQDAQLEAWMTPRYVCLSYDLPRDIVFDLLDINETERVRGPRRVDRLASNIGVSLDELTEMVRAAAAVYREQTDD